MLDIARETTNKKLSIALKKGSTANIQNNTGFLFHVFNSEYVEENIRPREYTPNGNIDGYILGKVQIDLTEERKQEEQLLADIENKEREIEGIIQAAQRRLQKNGVRQNQTEFSLLSKEKIYTRQEVSCDKSFDEIVLQLETLAIMPDNLSDIIPPTFYIDISALDEAALVLSTLYPKSDWDEEFAKTVKSKKVFIEQGLQQIGNKEVCPFCEQALGREALNLIHRYKAFLSDKEAQTIKQIEGIINSAQQMILGIKDIADNIELANGKILYLAKYLPSIRDVSLTIPDISEKALTPFNRIIYFLQTKADNVSSTNYSIDLELIQCKQMVDDIKKICIDNSLVVSQINTLKNSSSTERLNLRRDLCKAEYLRMQEKLASDLEFIFDKTKALNSLRQGIMSKEEQVRVSKKEKVFVTLNTYLNRFFAGKYSIDKDTFLIKFLGATHPKASGILSDGEKSIVAFCFYLASTHLLMERDGDYNKLFFIIDDPISSMDFNYVYAVAQSLRDIKAILGISSYERMFIFTHNLEFYSIITRNHIITQAYVMKPGKIEILKKQLLMPYESHLYDIARVAWEQEKPSHTTGNSIRHVLETVSRFEHPEKRLEKYVTENDVLKENSCIFSLCQDLSHGGIRTQPPFDEQVLVGACKTVIAFMEQRYQGQIDAIGAGN